SEGGIAGHGHDGDELVDDFAEAGVNSAAAPFRLRQAVAGAPHVTDHEGAGVKNGLDCLNDGAVVALHVGAANRPPASQRRVAGRLDFEHGVGQLVESGKVLAAGRIADTESVEVVEERLHDGLQLGGALVYSYEGVHT